MSLWRAVLKVVHILLCLEALLASVSKAGVSGSFFHQARLAKGKGLDET
jgi:hypothetical protein